MKLVKALSTSIIWRGIYFLSVLLLNILVARHFQADGSGQIYYIANIFSFVMILISLCLETPITYYLSKKKINETQMSVLALCWIIIVMIPAYFVITYFKDAKSIPLESNIFVSLATVFLTGNLLISFFTAMFYSKLDMMLPNLLLSGVNLLLILLVPNNNIMIQYITNEEYISLYFSGFLMQGILLSLFFMGKYVKWGDFKFIPFDTLRSIFSFAIIAVITNSISFIMYRIDYWFVNKYCNDIELGNYIQACKLAQLFFVVPSILAAVIFPLTASGRKEEMNEKIQLLSRGLIFFYTIICLVLFLIGYWLFPFVFGSSFKQMYWPFIFLFPAILSYSVTHLLTAYYGGKKVLGVNFWGSVLALSLIVIGDLLFIPAFGIKGAALVSSAGYICYMSFMMYVHTREYNTRFSDFLLFRKSDWRKLQETLAEKFFSSKPGNS